MSAPFAVGGANGVAVFVYGDIFCTVVDHRLYGYDHSRNELGTFARLAEVWDIRVFMNLATHTVPGEHFHNAVFLLAGTHKALHRMPYVAHGVAPHRRIYAKMQGL